MRIAPAIAALMLAMLNMPAAAQQLFVKQTQEQCNALGGRIITWTGTPQGTASTITNRGMVGECYVPPRVAGRGTSTMSGGGGSYASSLGMAGGILGLMAGVLELADALSEVNQGNAAPAAPAPPVDPWRAEWEQKKESIQQDLDRRAEDIRDFLSNDRRRVEEALHRRCPDTPATSQGITDCYNQAARKFEELAAACRDADGPNCRDKMMSSAAISQCVAQLEPSARGITSTEQRCGDADERSAVLKVASPAAAAPPSLLGRLDRRCLKTYAPTICDLLVRNEESSRLPLRPNLPYNCGRLGGEWVGDIVAGHCNRPGQTARPYDPASVAKRRLASLRQDRDALFDRARRGEEIKYRLALFEDRLADLLVAIVPSAPGTAESEVAEALQIVRQIADLLGRDQLIR